MSKNEGFTGPLSMYLEGIVEERHRMGYSFREEERLLHELDLMSQKFDCTDGLPEELVKSFIERKPNSPGIPDMCIRFTTIRTIFL